MDLVYLIVITILASAFFSGMEIAFITANKLKLEVERTSGGVIGTVLSTFTKRPAQFIGTVLLGNNIALVFFGLFISVALQPLFSDRFREDWPYAVLFVETVISTVIVLFFCEFWPKALFRLRPNLALRVLALPFATVYYLLYPLVMMMTFISRSVLTGLFRARVKESSPPFSRADLEYLVRESVPEEERAGDIDPELFEKALYLTKVRASACMVPRPEIQGIDISEGMEALRAKFVETQLSRLIVYDENVDHVLGYAHHQSLWKNPNDIRSMLFPMSVVPETMPALDALTLMLKERTNISLVVEEFGGTAGIMTLEDILEEIFGEIKDEHDEEEFVESRLSDTEFIFSGRLEIDYLNETYGLNLPTGEYETLGGLIIAASGSIPVKDQKITIEGFEFTIVRPGRTRVETARVKVLAKS